MSGSRPRPKPGSARRASSPRAGRLPGQTGLDFRAHGLARHGHRVAVFPRRPGNRFALVDLLSFEILTVITAPQGRHFYGHGAFSVDGGHLLVTENDLDTLQGGIGVYELGQPVRRLGRIDLPGPGPHEIARDQHSDLFHIALGGLETHPDYGRTALNPSTFRSQIVRLRLDRGALDPLGYWPGTEGLSLRHLATGARGQIYVGGQLVDPVRGRQERVLWVCRGENAESIEAGRALAGYVSSVASRGEETLVSSKEANIGLRLVGDRPAETFRLDGASAAALGPGLVSLSGYGTLWLNDARIAVSPLHEFDNHGLAVL